MKHEEATCEVHASPGAVFDHIDHPDQLFGRAYARWCVRQMAQDLVTRFA